VTAVPALSEEFLDCIMDSPLPGIDDLTSGSAEHEMVEDGFAHL